MADTVLAPTLYLILHKVRGEPAFDVAQKMCPEPPCQLNCGMWNGATCMAHEESWWIIPTSGHAAYPIDYWKLEDLCDVSDYPNVYPWNVGDAADISEAIEHFPTRAEKAATASNLLKLLGLGQGQHVARR